MGVCSNLCGPGVGGKLGRIRNLGGKLLFLGDILTILRGFGGKFCLKGEVVN